MKEIKGYCLLETVCFSFMPARQGIFVRDTLGLVLGKCCKVHSVTKQAWLHITVGNITYIEDIT